MTGTKLTRILTRPMFPPNFEQWGLHMFSRCFETHRLHEYKLDDHRTSFTANARASPPTHELHRQRTSSSTIAPALSTAVAPARRTSHNLHGHRTTSTSIVQGYTTIARAARIARLDDHRRSSIAIPRTRRGSQEGTSLY